MFHGIGALAGATRSRARSPVSGALPALQSVGGGPIRIRIRGGRGRFFREDVMKRLGVSLALLCLAFGIGTASAQDKYPSKPVKIVVPYAPGGATDITSRLFGEQFRQSLGQQFVV